nr:S8 family serine peptidase [Mycoplasmopsis canis]WQQ12652.1 S8 family serine peptidase [Mycoplasmopsis canis]
MKKIKKILTVLPLLPIVTSISLINNTKNSVQLEKESLIKHPKIIYRKNLIKNFDISNINNNFNNDFEIKILLNSELYDEKDIQKNLNNFFEEITTLGLNFKSYEKSSIMPILWFYFNSENERKIFIEKIIENKNIDKIIFYENNYKPLKKIDDFGTHLIPDPNIPGKYIEYTPESMLKKDENMDKFYKSLIKNEEILGISDENDNEENYKIGVVEVSSFSKDNRFNDLYKVYFDLTSIETKNFGNFSTGNSSHSTLVSLIAGGNKGVSNNSKVLLAVFDGKNASWQKSIEWLVLEKGVKIINHSYGSTLDLLEKNYNENNYFLDYISRKYGVVNIFASGNGNDRREKKNEFINGKSASLNSIVVGALSEIANKEDLKNNELSTYSNFKKYIFPEMAKPLVVAPAFFWDPIEKSYTSGTSFSSPMISGLVALFFKKFPELDIDDFRIPIIKTILSVSSTTSLNNRDRKSNGFDDKYGAGTPNFSDMIKARNNLSFIDIRNEKANKTVFEKELYLGKNEKIKISSSWLFNAGMLENKEEKPNLGFGWYLKWFNFLSENKINNWEKEHKTEDWLKINTFLNKTKNLFFTNYNLHLEILKDNKEWATVETISSKESNDELLIYRTKKSGLYRIVVKEIESALFKNSVNDKLAISYLVSKDV